MKSRVGAVIFSRLDSKRLPCKALIPIAGKPLINRVISRCERSNVIDSTIISTSRRQCEKKLIDHLGGLGITISFGPLEKMCLRAIEACRIGNLDHIVRVCGDRPLFSGLFTDLAVEYHLESRSDITFVHVGGEKISQGLTTEVIRKRALQKYMHEVDEHMTTNMYKDKSLLIRGLDVSHYWKSTYNESKFVVDTQSDLERISRICMHMDNIDEACWLDELATFS